MYNPEARQKYIEAERERIKTDINRRCYYLKTPIEYYILFPGDVRPTKMIYTPLTIRKHAKRIIKERNEHGTFYVNVCNPDYIVPQILKGTKYINFTITV